MNKFKENTSENFNKIKNEALFDYKNTMCAPLFEKTTYPHEILGEINTFVSNLGENLDKSEYFSPKIGIFIHKSTILHDSVTLIAPTIICENAELRKGAFLRGGVFVGKNCTVGNSVEIKNSILIENVQIPHFNYVGDSIFGRNSHMGAGGITSNLKSDKTAVTIKVDGDIFETNRKKVGAFVGDGAEIGCNAILNPGSVIGKNTTVQPLASVRGYIAENSICKKNGEVIKKMQKEQK